jgi:hypothetical protein
MGSMLSLGRDDLADKRQQISADGVRGGRNRTDAMLRAIVVEHHASSNS